MNEGLFGPLLTRDSTTFRLWAPAAQRVDLLLDRAHALNRGEDGWFNLDVPGVKAGARYRFRIDDSVDVTDPASQFQPNDVSGPSEVVDHERYTWRATDWRGRVWEDTVLLETHVGTFTPLGTYRAMIEKLDHVVATGFTALELMPLADFPGRRNWGYDGVLWYAPDHAYGTPDDLKTLIDEAHLRGLMVFLDVVYNHFGPEGNYLSQYAPGFFKDAQTPWGSAIDYSVPQVRAFAIENALHWLRDYRFDGLRLDAVHAIVDQDEQSLLADLSTAVGELAEVTQRHIHLVLENDDNCARLLDPDTDPVAGQYRAQWNDDYHHAWHVALTGETHGYYADYKGEPCQHVARALASGFVYQGEPSPHRNGSPRGEPSGALPPTAFVNFLQNHDQIGNRVLGDRLESVADRQAIEAALTITLLAPAIPLLFMGEEWASTKPFPFFCDFQGELADAVRNGRKREFAAAYEAYGDAIPDPLDDSTFRSAMLDWADLETADARQRLTLVRDLLQVRRREISPRLAGARFGAARLDGPLLTATWRLGDSTPLHLEANLSDSAVEHPSDSPEAKPIWGDFTTSIGPWSVVWKIGTP